MSCPCHYIIVHLFSKGAWPGKRPQSYHLQTTDVTKIGAHLTVSVKRALNFVGIAGLQVTTLIPFSGHAPFENKFTIIGLGGVC